MASPVQVDTHRRNARQSSGLASVAGKAASRMNALQSGLTVEFIVIRGEDPAELHALIAQYQLDYAPLTSGEQALVDNLVANLWLQRRQLRIESQLFERQFASREYYSQTALGEACVHAGAVLAGQGRRFASLVREYRHTLKELLRIQAARPQDEPLPPDPAAVAAENGFVPSPSLEPASAAPASTPVAQSAGPQIGFVSSNPQSPVSFPHSEEAPAPNPVAAAAPPIGFVPSNPEAPPAADPSPRIGFVSPAAPPARPDVRCNRIVVLIPSRSSPPGT